MTRLRQSAILTAAAMIAGMGAASAQTTIITQEPTVQAPVVVQAPTVIQAPVRSQTVVTTTAPAQLQLTPVQRQRIYRTIVHERSAPVQGAVAYRVGTRIPDNTQLYTVPQEIAVEVPAVKTYKYMVVNGQVLLVDPATSQVVAEVAD